MPGSFSKPILIASGANTGVVLPKVPLTGEQARIYSEDWLQDVMYRFPEALPIDEIDSSFAHLVPLCREMNTEAGPVDNVYITPTGKPVLVEAKLWRNPEARRKVFSQILDYAKELSRWTVEEFDTAVRSARRTRNEPDGGLLDVVRRAVGEMDEAKFYDAVSLNLSRGEFLLLIVGDGIRENVAAMAEYLDKNRSLHFTFGLIEMAIYALPDGAHLVQPRILAQSAILHRIVIELNGAGRVVEEEASDGQDGVGDEGLLKNRERYLTFWSEFLTQLQLDDKSQLIPDPTPSTNQSFAMPSPANVRLSARLLQMDESAGVYIRFKRNAVGNRIYERLLEEKADINKALGVPVSWDSNDERHRVIAIQKYSGNLIDDRSTEVQSWMADRVNRFINVFKPRIRRFVEEADLR